MKGFAPSLFDRLMNDSARSAANPVISRLSIEELKDTVARDLEAMLNTRAVIPEDLLKNFPECGKSIVAYGLNDFAGMSLASIDDRNAICRSLEGAIARHEPRLRNVRATLEIREGAINRLNFAISALLVVNAAREAVSFDAVLQPSTLQYSISKTRPTRIGI
ncbi:type VI secretion system baseplate subunit TssE [Herbaspirillum sp. YR522]|uniref:type VI secretion system baseplate subunit TssE n=1 Tax=Herbaspirillum sp. YR522 TaxID=1144342 RepID=UPI00026FAB3D|nr:type VI secretion system baseplate subunit TssE [Herbaspirillum sp. YR522]EJN00481.1 type VI secretion system lysozyme-related protein [Herbaspirillum sp. YR522]